MFLSNCEAPKGVKIKMSVWFKKTKESIQWNVILINSNKADAVGSASGVSHISIVSKCIQLAVFTSDWSSVAHRMHASHLLLPARDPWISAAPSSLRPPRNLIFAFMNLIIFLFTLFSSVAIFCSKIRSHHVFCVCTTKNVHPVSPPIKLQSSSANPGLKLIPTKFLLSIFE